MIPAEILKQVKLLEISTRKLVNNIFAGEYNTAFKGQGMTFAEFREYVPGDDVRSISWNMMAKTSVPYIKKFDEERELSVYLVVDISRSQDFGSQKYFKGEVLVHLSALLAFSAAKNKDQVGCLLYSDRVEHFVPAVKGSGQVHRILRDLFYHRPQGSGTSLLKAVQYLLGVVKKRSAIFILSDFQDDSDYDTALRILSRKHDVTAFVVQDQLEFELPNLGLIDLQDSETGEIFTVDTSSPIVQRDFKEVAMQEKLKRDQKLKKSQVARVDLQANSDYVNPLVKYFRSRGRA